MGDISIPQRQSETNFESMRAREAGQVREVSDLVGLLQNSKLDALELFAQTGLPEIYYAETVKKFLIDPQNAKSIDKFTSIYRDLSTNLSDFQFQEMFHDFCEDQLVSKGYFDPNEAYEEWPSFVNERNETAREMNRIAEGLVPAATQKVAGANIEVKKEDQVEEDKMVYMWLCLNMLSQVSTTVQEIAMTQATQLEIETLKQDAYLTIQNSLKTMSPNDPDLFKDPGSDEAMAACDAWNTIDLPNAQEKNRSYKEASQERSKTINSNINNTTAVLQRLMDIFSDILSKITSMNMSIIR